MSLRKDSESSWPEKWKYRSFSFLEPSYCWQALEILLQWHPMVSSRKNKKKRWVCAGVFLLIRVIYRAENAVFMHCMFSFSVLIVSFFWTSHYRNREATDRFWLVPIWDVVGTRRGDSRNLCWVRWRLSWVFRSESSWGPATSVPEKMGTADMHWMLLGGDSLGLAMAVTQESQETGRRTADKSPMKKLMALRTEGNNWHVCPPTAPGFRRGEGVALSILLFTEKSRGQGIRI